MRRNKETDRERFPEELCERCGRCCREKLIVDDTVYVLPSYCRYYDPATRLCTIYERRHELNPQCLDVETGVKLGVFPADCPYVRHIPGYVPPIEDVVTEDMLNEIESGAISTAEEFEERIRALSDASAKGGQRYASAKGKPSINANNVVD